MADLAVTAANLRELEAVQGRRITMIANVAVTKGQVLYRIASGVGKAGLARANAVGTAKVVGIATSSVAAGEPVEALRDGKLVGIDLAALAPGATVYLSPGTAGAIDGALPATTGQVVAALGTVHCMTDVAGTKYLQVHIPQNLTPTALP